MTGWFCNDLMDDSPPLLVKARLEFLPSEAGGREAAISPFPDCKYRPNHNFAAPDNRNMYIGQVEWHDGCALHPGESYEVEIRFFGAPGLTTLLTPGRRWRIQEGAKLVAMGEILDWPHIVEQMNI